MLGNTKIEGIVIKNHSQSIILGGKSQIVMAKYVRTEFKELNKKEWNVGIPLQDRIISQFPKEPRFIKVVQHCRDEGLLSNSPKDFAVLIPRINKDIESECESVVKEMLWQDYKRGIIKGISNGFINWYKEKLMTETKK